MAASVNKTMLLGNVTRDPEMRYTPGGVAVCEFGLALNRNYTKKDSGEKVEEVCFVDIVAWARTAEVCAEHVKKGRQLHVEGRLQQDRWETQEGQKRSKIKVVAEQVTFVGSRGEGAKKEDAPAADIPL